MPMGHTTFAAASLAILALAADAAPRAYELATPTPRPAGAPKASDVIMRSLGVHPRHARDRHDTLQALRDFHATRLEWAYITNKGFIAKVKAMGRLFGAAASAPSWRRHGRSKGWEAVCIVDLDGEVIIAPWKRAWKSKTLWGCMNNPDLEAGYVAYLKTCIDAGADVIQRDEPEGNASAVGWGGCFCKYCMSGFRGYLAKHTTPAQRARLGVGDIETFDYGEFLRTKHGLKRDEFRKWPNDELKKLFRRFQEDTTLAFHARTRQALNEYAGRRVAMSCNNGCRAWGPIQMQFDWAFGELWFRDATPHFLFNAMRKAAARGKMQVVTMPKKGNDDDPKAWERLTRQAIAMAYACGGHCMVPWDVYMPGPAPRYFGRPEQYADLYAFIRAAAPYFDGYEFAGAVGPGIRCKVYAKAPALHLPAGDVVAVARAMPGKPDAPVVVHLVDWSAEPKPFTATLSPGALFGEAPLLVKLLTPAAYDAAAHARAEDTGDFSGLIRATVLARGYAPVVEVPALAPWGLLVIEPDPNAKPGVWAPAIVADDASYYQGALAVRMECASAGATIRYTIDGSAPTAASPRYAGPIKLMRSATVRAVAFLADGRKSDAASAAFTKLPLDVKPLMPDAASLMPNLKLWLAADTLARKLGDGDAVLEWPARVGPSALALKRKGYAGAVLGPPTFRAHAMNGQPVVRFDGKDDQLAIANFANEHLAGGAFTIFVVTQSEDSSFGICGNGLAGTGGIPRLYLTRGSARYNVFGRALALMPPGSGPMIAAYMHDGVATFSGASNGRRTPVLDGMPAVEKFGGGNLSMPFWSGNRNHAGDIAEVVVYDRKLSDAERMAVEMYLAVKYGVKYRRRWQ